MNLFEIRREVLVRSEVRCPFGKVWHIQQVTAARTWMSFRLGILQNDPTFRDVGIRSA
jgi:hypothetical protein